MKKIFDPNNNKNDAYLNQAIEVALNELTTEIETRLKANPDGSVTIYEGLFDEVVARSTLKPLRIFDAPAAKCFFQYKNSYKEYSLTGYYDRKLIHMIMNMMKYNKYHLGQGGLDISLCIENTKGLSKLINYGVTNIESKTESALVSINQAFNVLKDNSVKAHVDHINDFGKDKDSDLSNMILNSSLREFAQFTVNDTAYQVILSDTEYVIIIAEPNAHSYDFLTGRISDNNEIHLPNGAKFEINDSGLEVLEMSLYGVTSEFTIVNLAENLKQLRKYIK